ncbi:DUF4129 domain-containing protein [Nocardioides marmorisolisilvae]|uniref:DUF4129 domain-containing protein n=1 Tax=Nocardioides marmorisolisilvae TaxID=1542737 RepID=A0A3N0DZP4_9ACTN|nr:DUF4129 domain-containing protein [Nocardioides marmorisolisilvae]RNL81031.1 DUF4129 domain-containing protein [Nocardioides marmorisolisilvae]
MIPLLPLELRPDPGPAQDWVRNELAKPEYQPSLLERVVRWFGHLLGKLLDATGNIGRIDPVLGIPLLVLLLVGVALALTRLRRDPRRAGTERSVLEDARTTAAQYRARAGKALSEERWDDAVLDGVRAIAAGLVERALADDLPSATAHEVADAAAQVFPAERARLDAAARLFDDVRYGDRHATRAGATDVLDLERALRHLRPESTTASGPVLAVPR